MDNSPSRLIELVIASLSEQVLPHLADDFARGQLFGVLFTLRSLARKADWSADYQEARLSSVETATAELSSALGQESPPDGPRDLDGLLRLFCDIYEGAESGAARLDPAGLNRVEDVVRRFVTARLRSEISYTVPLNFGEISTGQASQGT